MKRVIMCMAISIIAIQLNAQIDQKRINALETFLEERMEKDQIPGLLVAASYKGELIYTKSLGMASLEHKVPVTDSTVFEIGSISKQFTAALIVMLEEENKLSLDDPISKYVTEIPGEWYGVTIKQLLNHTSGIPDYEAIAGYQYYDNRCTPMDIIKVANSKPLDFKPGEKFRYCNTGYYLLSMIIERVTNKSFSACLSDKILEPLQMTRTGLFDPTEIIDNRASGYSRTKSRIENRRPTEPSSTLGAGGMSSTIADMAKWDAALYGNSILSTEALEKLWAPGVLNNGSKIGYGLGWRIEPYKGHKEQYHYGMMYGFVANITRFSDDRLTFFVFANRYQLSLGRIVEAVMEAFVPDLTEE